MARKVLERAATTIFVVAALTLACWFAFSWASGATLVMFRTGSMSPAMPQGALAISLPVTASELRPGDVATLQRAGESLPVTHRVVSVSAVTPQPANAPDLRATAPGGAAPNIESPTARQIVMQGDANDTPDALPYVATEARLVVFAVPGLGNALALAQSPIGLGFLLLAAGSITVWAFWPAKPEESSGFDRNAPHDDETLRSRAQSEAPCEVEA